MSPHPTLPTRTIETEADIASLQRELAEARAACQQAVDAMRDYPAYPEDADADKLASACKRCEMVLAPGPSDAKGEGAAVDFWTLDKANACIRGIGVALGIDDPGTTAFGIGLRIIGAIESLKSRASLTPLTDPAVRGVLVACNTSDAGGSVVALPDGGHCWGKLRPASEFGVPGEPIPVQVHSKLEALAESLGIKDWQAAGTSTLATLIAEAVDKLKSTPAEPVQKLVPLPEGVVVLVKREGRSPVVGEYINVNGNLCFVDKHWRGETSDEIWTPLDPALYGVDAERVRELEAAAKLRRQTNEALNAEIERHARCTSGRERGG